MRSDLFEVLNVSIAFLEFMPCTLKLSKYILRIISLSCTNVNGLISVEEYGQKIHHIHKEIFNCVQPLRLQFMRYFSKFKKKDNVRGKPVILPMTSKER